MEYEKVVQKANPLNSSGIETYQKYIPEESGAREKLFQVNHQFQLKDHDALNPDHDSISKANNRKISNYEESKREHEVRFAKDLGKREGKKTLTKIMC